MKLSQFGYFLPDNLIASHPIQDRDKSRLLVLNRETKKIEHKVFQDVVNYFEENDVLVFNNTKVFPAVLSGRKEKTDADIAVFLLRERNQ